MSEQFSDRLKIISIESESTYGVDPASSPFYLACYSVSITPVTTFKQRDLILPVMSRAKSLAFTSHCTVELEFPLTGKSGAAGTAPAWAPLLLASGHQETIVASTSAGYTPLSKNTMADTPSVFINEWHLKSEIASARLQAAGGVRGNFTVRMTEENEWIGVFSGEGLFTELASSDASPPALPSTIIGLDDVIKSKSMTLTIDSVTMPATSFEMTTGREVAQERAGITGSNSVGKILLMSGEGASGSLDLHDGSTALDKYLSEYGSEGELALVCSGASVNGNTVSISAPKLQFLDKSKNEGTLSSFGISFQLNGEWDGSSEAGDNEYTILFT